MLVHDGLLAVGERDAVELEPAVDPSDRLALRLVGDVLSASRTELILSIAAAADCTWPYSSESSCSGWKTSCEQADGGDQRPDLRASRRR